MLESGCPNKVLASQVVIDQTTSNSNLNRNSIPRIYVRRRVTGIQTPNIQKSAGKCEHNYCHTGENNGQSEKNGKLKIRNIQEINRNLKVFSNQQSSETNKSDAQRESCSNENASISPGGTGNTIPTASVRGVLKTYSNENRAQNVMSGCAQPKTSELSTHSSIPLPVLVLNGCTNHNLPTRTSLASSNVAPVRIAKLINAKLAPPLPSSATNRLPQHDPNQQSNTVNLNRPGTEINRGGILNHLLNSTLNASGGMLNESRTHNPQNTQTGTRLLKPTKDASLHNKQSQSGTLKDSDRMAGVTSSATGFRTKLYQALADPEKQNRERFPTRPNPNTTLSEQNQHRPPAQPVASTSQMPATWTIPTSAGTTVVKRIEASGSSSAPGSAKKAARQNVVNSQPIDVDQMDVLRELNSHQDLSIFAISKETASHASTSANKDNEGAKSSDKGESN